MWLGGCLVIFLRFFSKCKHEVQHCQVESHFKSSVFIASLLGLFFFSTAIAQDSQVNGQVLTSTTHDVAVALDMLPFSINAMKTEAVVLTEDLVDSSTQQIMGRSAFSSSDPTKLSSAKLLQKVIQPPHRSDFKLNGAVAFVESYRSPVIQNYGFWEPKEFYDVDKLIFDQDGYLIAQKSFYYSEEIPKSDILEVGGWLNRVWWPGKNRNKKKLEAEQDAAKQILEQGKGRKIEGCYALDIDFEAEGFDCFDAENRILTVTEWSPAGKIIRTDSYKLHDDGPWVEVHFEKSSVAPEYEIERKYDVAGNLIEYKSSGNIEKKHLRFFYNENNQRVTEAVLDPSTEKAIECKFLIYGYFDTLEAVNYYRVNEAPVEVEDNQASAFRSPLAQQNYMCEKEIPSIITLQRSTVMDYGWLYDDNNLLAGRRKQEISHYDANGTLIDRTIYSYLESEPTTLAGINKYDSSGQSTASIVFDYDRQGRLVKEERFQFAGGADRSTGETGRLLEQSNYIYKAKETTLLEKTVEDYEHSRSKSIKSFDEAGNIVREQRYELMNRFGVLNNIFRLKSDVSRSYTGRSFVNEVQQEEGNSKLHESYSYLYDYAEGGNGGILNWIQKDEGSFVDKFDSNYSEPHHTNARRICYYPDSLAMSPNLVCSSPFD